MENKKKYIDMKELFRKYEEICAKYGEILCKKISSFPLGSETWKNSELLPRLWNLEQFLSLLFRQIQTVGETPSEARFEGSLF